MSDIDKLNELNKKNKEQFREQKKKESLSETVHMAIGVCFLVVLGYCCYQWGYSSAQNEILLKKLVDKQATEITINE